LVPLDHPSLGPLPAREAAPPAAPRGRGRKPGDGQVIATVTGPPGAGKTFYAIRKMAEALEQGKVIASNVEMTDGWLERLAKRNVFTRAVPGRVKRRVAAWERQALLTDDLQELFSIRLHGQKEGRGVMVLDEAHGWMNARMWKDEDRLDIVRFFSQHRKLGWDVFLITQDMNNIDRQVRSLSEYHVQLRNLKRMKYLGVPLAPMDLFLAVWTWHTAGKAVVKREVYGLNGTRKLYDTRQLLHGAAATPGDAIWLPRDADA
jgi:Zonular occludens toxin (Zot)